MAEQQVNTRSALWRKGKSLLGKPLYGIYVLIFIGACISIFRSNEQDISSWFPDEVHYAAVVILVGVSIVHIILVYLSMHEIEEKEDEWRMEYNGWIGTPFELILRWSIVVSLIWFSGKIIVDSVPSSLIGAFIMGFLLIWDAASILISKRKSVSDLINPAKNVEAKFFWSDSVGCCLWIALYTTNKGAISTVAYFAGTLYLGIIVFRLYSLHVNNYRFLKSSQPAVGE